MIFKKSDLKRWHQQFREDFQFYLTNENRMLWAFYVCGSISKNGRPITKNNRFSDDFKELQIALAAIDAGQTDTYTVTLKDKRLGSELREAGINIKNLRPSDMLRYEAAAFMAVSNITEINDRYIPSQSQARNAEEEKKREEESRGEANKIWEDYIGKSVYTSRESFQRLDAEKKQSLAELASTLKKTNLKKFFPLTIQQKVALAVVGILLSAAVVTAIFFTAGAAAGGLAGGIALLSSMSGGASLAAGIGVTCGIGVGMFGLGIALGQLALSCGRRRSPRVAPADPRIVSESKQDLTQRSGGLSRSPSRSSTSSLVTSVFPHLTSGSSEAPAPAERNDNSASVSTTASSLTSPPIQPSGAPPSLSPSPLSLSLSSS